MEGTPQAADMISVIFRSDQPHGNEVVKAGSLLTLYLFPSVILVVYSHSRRILSYSFCHLCPYLLLLIQICLLEGHSLHLGKSLMFLETIGFYLLASVYLSSGTLYCFVV